MCCLLFLHWYPHVKCLYFPDFRYWDLIRWHQLDKLDNSVNPDILLGANVSNDPDINHDKSGDYIDGSTGRISAFEAKHYQYPIPSGHLT